MGEPEKNAKKRLFDEIDDDDDDEGQIITISNDNGVGVGANEEEENEDLDLEEEEEEAENYYNSDREPSSNIGPEFISQYSATYAAHAAMAEASAQDGPSGSQNGAISTQERVFLRGDGDFAMTQTQKGKTKICYDGYR